MEQLIKKHIDYLHNFDFSPKQMSYLLGEYVFGLLEEESFHSFDPKDKNTNAFFAGYLDRIERNSQKDLQ